MKKPTRIRVVVDKTPSENVDCFGFPLPAVNTRIKLARIVADVKTTLGQLEARAMSGDAEALKEFDRLLAVYGSKHQHLLRERAKDGDKTFNGSHSIQELLWLADDTISCLGWLAKNKSADCVWYAERRMNWPGFISVLPDIEKKSQAIKACIPLGKKFRHYNKNRTQADILFQIARFVISLFSEKPSVDSYSSFYFAPFIKGVE
jgi:hypothetical protein